MEDKRKIKSQLKRELVELRQQVGELEASKIECDQAKTESDSTIAEWMGTTSTRARIPQFFHSLTPPNLDCLIIQIKVGDDLGKAVLVMGVCVITAFPAHR